MVCQHVFVRAHTSDCTDTHRDNLGSGSQQHNKATGGVHVHVHMRKRAVTRSEIAHASDRACTRTVWVHVDVHTVWTYAHARGRADTHARGSAYTHACKPTFQSNSPSSIIARVPRALTCVHAYVFKFKHMNRYTPSYVHSVWTGSYDVHMHACSYIYSQACASTRVHRVSCTVTSSSRSEISNTRALRLSLSRAVPLPPPPPDLSDTHTHTHTHTHNHLNNRATGNGG